MESRNMLGFILNIPHTIIGLLVGLVSIPQAIKWNEEPRAVIVKVKNFWWTVSYMRNTRAMAIGHVVLLGPRVEDRDLEHELIHVQQHQKLPLIQPVFYLIELLRKGYWNNKYEEEAYRLSGSRKEI